MNGIQCIYNIFGSDAGGSGDFLNGRFGSMLFHKHFPGVDGLIGCIPKRPADPDTVVVPKIPADLTHDHRHCISTEFYIHGTVKIVDGFHEADAADLK